MPAPDPAPTPKPSAGGSYAETFVLPHNSPDADLSKEEQDIALAASLLESGAISERQLGTALSQWSIHGSVPLAEHLEKSGVLKGPQIEQLSKRAAQRSHDSRQADKEGSPQSASLSHVLDRIDSSGRVARVLGLSMVTRSDGLGGRASETRYVLVRKLGQGGLGRVWLAYDSSLRRHVALKELTDGDAASDATLRRFQNEAEITGRLEHPGIVPLYQLGQDKHSGGVFYTMRFLGKSTLQTAIVEYHERREEGDDNPMLLRELLTAFVSICQAIAHAHSRRVIHRDLKPENVVIDSFGQVIVIDWGLAKVLDETTPDLPGQADGPFDASRSGTMEGQVLGTPMYMAPEQASGRLDEIDARTDVYGLGAILYAIITGVAPHESTQGRLSESRGGARALLSEISSGPTPIALQQLPSADPSLSAICAKAMARRRYARYQEASELAEDVQRWMAGESVTCYQEPPTRRLRRWANRNPRLSQTIGALGLVALISGLMWAGSAHNARIAEEARRYEELRSDFHEVQFLLQYSSDALTRNCRFMSSIPPIQGIVRARGGSTEDSEAVWDERLATIFAGLLRANANYLSVSFVAAIDGGAEGILAEEIVRVDRSTGDRWLVRTVPQARLLRDAELPLLTATSQLEPGEATMVFSPPEGGAQRTLSLGVPVFDESTGAWFGAVAIEMDLSGQLELILSSIVLSDEEQLIVGLGGEAWLVADASGVRPVGSVAEEDSADWAAADAQVQAFLGGQGPRVLADGHSLYGERFALGRVGPELVVVAKTIDAR
ncbi:Serine/threonine-protein kinase PknD [Pirellulimonas nuda]|uniref:Serine/threonine-protein kinase PknD n=1 Tax=Pirellulimonas nuda TaxID=2528009 RepID=A0A518DI80_9BACT|nr:serine/threonine-protein kinase [Pirellulimonas nuda]QDU91188.1 Serine/threonine-protein kinase PknD [Pirellulimonas nuda]